MSASRASTSGPVLSSIAKYALLILLFVASIAAYYVVKAVPSAADITGAGTSLAGLFAFAVADLEAGGDPKPIPTGTTFVIITAGTGIFGAAGYYSGQTFIEWSAFLAWLLYVLEYVLTTFRAQLENYVPSAYDSWVVAGLGLLVSVVQYLAANPTASLDSLVVTGVVSLASYLNNSSTSTGAGGSSPPAVPPPSAPAPAG